MKPPYEDLLGRLLDVEDPPQFDSSLNDALQSVTFALGMGLAILVLIVSLVTVGTLLGFIVGAVLGVVAVGVIAVCAQIFSCGWEN